MDIRETVSVAIDALRANKLRAILTSLGVIIGSASIVLVVTVALTSKQFVLSQIESIGSNLIQVELVTRPEAAHPLSYEMTLGDRDAAKSIPNVMEVVRLLDVQAARTEDVPSVERQVAQLLRSRHPAEAEYKVLTLAAILNAAKNISLALTIVLIIIAFIALVISGIGIMNIMLVTVTERTREIGIRKAIGAARREILYQFLIESFLISGGGAVLGILIGIAVPVTIQSFLPGNLRVPVSPLSVIIAFVVSCSTGLFFGYLPANQAASLQPVESLRYE